MGILRVHLDALPVRLPEDPAVLRVRRPRGAHALGPATPPQTSPSGAAGSSGTPSACAPGLVSRAGAGDRPLDAVPLPPLQRQPRGHRRRRQLVDRPVKKKVEGPKEPLNILVMGSDTREAGNNIDNLTGGGERSDTTILLHLSADRDRAYGISIPRDSMVDRPECLDEGRRRRDPRGSRRDVERGVLRRRPGLHGPAVRAADRRVDRPLRRRRLRRLRGHGRRDRRRPGVHPRGHQRPGARHQPRPAPASSRASEALNYVARATRWATAPTSAG